MPGDGTGTPTPSTLTAGNAAGARSRLVVSLVVIGNEVLSGKVVEQNAPFLIGRMKALGARVREVVIVEDDVAAIVEALARVRVRSDEVLVTGGVGPTHDDVTIEAVAKALGVPVVEDATLLGQIERLGRGSRGDRPLSAGERRLARVPAGAQVLFAERVPWPVTKVANLWLFPGIPPLLQALFEGLVGHFAGSPPIFSAVLELLVEEATICEALDAIVHTHSQVQIGSYPRREHGVWHLRLTFESPAAEATQASIEAARAAFARYLGPA